MPHTAGRAHRRRRHDRRPRSAHTRLRDPLAIGAAVVLLSAAALIAALIPALRASRVDPSLALREE